MVLEYNTSAHNQGIPESEMYAVVGNLIDSSTPPAPEFEAPEWYGFDIAAVGMGWHHFSDPGYAAKRLSERLKTGGVLLIVDFLPHEGFGHSHAHSHAHGEKHHGHGHGHGGRKADGYGEDKKMEGAAAHTVTHFGFSEEDIKKMFEQAGVGEDFKFVVLGKGVVFESEGKSIRRTAFMARGRKG
jgi:SAM-dependent methyltransferase